MKTKGKGGGAKKGCTCGGKGTCAYCKKQARAMKGGGAMKGGSNYA